MNKISEGEWEVETVYGDHFIVLANNEIVADCFGDEAYARFIAAAPEMYRVLKAFAECRHEDGMFGLMEDAQELTARIDSETSRDEQA